MEIHSLERPGKKKKDVRVHKQKSLDLLILEAFSKINYSMTHACWIRVGSGEGSL